MEIKRTKKRCGLLERRCKDSNFCYVFNVIKVEGFFLLTVKAFHIPLPLFFFPLFTPVNAFKTFFGKAIIFKAPIRARNPYIIFKKLLFSKIMAIF